MSGIGFVTNKAPSGGYELSKILSMEGGALQVEVVAYRTTLAEVQAIEHSLKSNLFGEEAWVPAQWPRPVRPLQPPGLEHEPMDMPKVVEDQQHAAYAANSAAGLLDRLKNGSARALVPALFLAGVWLSTRLGGLA